MNKELEEAIIVVRKLKNVNEHNKLGKSIETVLQALENYQIKELQFLNDSLSNVSATEFKVIMEPYYIQQEKLKCKDKIINELTNKLENSIPKEAIEDKIKDLESNKEYLSKFKDWNEKEYTNEDLINACLEILKELLKGK